jgi:hypothetical protein
MWLPPGFHWDLQRPDYVLAPPDYRVSLEAPASQIKAALKSRGFAEKTGENSFRVTSGGTEALPVVIESTYVAKGEVHSDRALYLLLFSWKPPEIVSRPPQFPTYKGEPSLMFTALQLERRIDASAQLDEVLNEALERTLTGRRMMLDPYVAPYRRPWFGKK